MKFCLFSKLSYPIFATKFENTGLKNINSVTNNSNNSYNIMDLI